MLTTEFCSSMIGGIIGVVISSTIVWLIARKSRRMTLYSELYKKQFELYPELIDDLHKVRQKASKKDANIKPFICKIRDNHVKNSIFYPGSFVKALWGYGIPENGETPNYSKIREDFGDMINLLRKESGVDKLQEETLRDLS